MIPDVVNITEAELNDRYGLGQLIFAKGTVIVEDRAYFDFTLTLQRIKTENVFVTYIKTNTVYTSIRELASPKDLDKDITKDGIIMLSSNKAKKTGICQEELHHVHV